MQPWPKTADDEVVKVGWRTLVKKTFRMPDGREESFTTKDGMQEFACAVIALTEDNKVIIAEQFRPGPERILQEIPGGGGKLGEDPQDVAMRELREETGYTSDSVSFLGKIYKDAYTNSCRYYYLARDCKQTSETEHDDAEFIGIKTISINDLFTNAHNSAMTDTEAIFLAYETLNKLKEDE